LGRPCGGKRKTKEDPGAVFETAGAWSGGGGEKKSTVGREQKEGGEN